MKRPKTTRWRHVLRMVSILTLVAVLVACGGGGQTTGEEPELPPPADEVPGASPITGDEAASPETADDEAAASPDDGQGAAEVPQDVAPSGEAPALTERVEAGELPPLEERLPGSPMVLQPVEGVGTYGGTWNTALKGIADGAWLDRTLNYDHLVRWKPDMSSFSTDEVIPDIAASFEVSEDATEYTFFLREGMKWSDGEPFTADDIMFWYEDVFLNEDLTPTQASWLTAGGEPVTVEKVDDYTVIFRFAAPNGLFLQRLATPVGDYPINYPRHYMEQFHQKYNENVGQQAEAEGLDDWIAYFGSQADWVNNKDKPTLNAWVLTQPPGEGTQQVIAERNPYYWKIDTEGNQLPYIDRIVYDVIEDEQVMVLRALNGEIDMQDRHIASITNKPIFFDSQEAGQYHFFNTIPSSMNYIVVALNLTVDDEVKREVFNNKDFRIGLSHAINRQEIIGIVYVEQGEPYQAAPRPESPFYNEELAKQYTEYDVALANEHLDKVLPEKNAEGLRLGPDGQPFFFTIETTAAPGSGQEADVLELIRGYWRAVGIDMRIKPEDRSLFYERKEGNQPDATTWGGDGGLDVTLEPRWYFPYSTESNFAIPWANWYNAGGLQGEIPEGVEGVFIEPPDAAKQQMELYNQLQDTADPEEQAALMNQILQIAQEQFWVIGIALPTEGYGIVKNNFHNVPETFTAAYLNLSPGHTNPPQYYIEGE